MDWRNAMAVVALACGVVGCASGGATLASRGESGHEPVKVVADARFVVRTTAGTAASLALYVSRDWDELQPQVTRAVIVVHGIGRDVAGYWHAANRGLAASDAAPGAAEQTLLIAPQFLDPDDIGAHALPPDLLRWDRDGWPAGADARGPVPLSSFEVLDAMLARLADRSRFPALRDVVLAGHSAGGQLVQRYAVVGRAGAALEAEGVHVRYVSANPSSYLYFSSDRPASAAAACPRFDSWRYGWNGAPPYAQAMSPADYEAAYAARDVVYLLGTDDTDPEQRDLDRSCAAQMQGATRYARGVAYFDYLQRRHPAMTGQRVVTVEGVGHSGAKMIDSPCGEAVLFGAPGCR